MRSRVPPAPRRWFAPYPQHERQNWQRVRRLLKFQSPGTSCIRPVLCRFDPTRTAVRRTSRCEGESAHRTDSGESPRAVRRDSCLQKEDGYRHRSGSGRVLRACGQRASILPAREGYPRSACRERGVPPSCVRASLVRSAPDSALLRKRPFGAWNRTPRPAGDRVAMPPARRLPQSGNASTDRPGHGRLGFRFPHLLLPR